MRYGVFVNRFLVADFSSREKHAAVVEAVARRGEVYDFWTGYAWVPYRPTSETFSREEAIEYLKSQLKRNGMSL